MMTFFKEKSYKRKLYYLSIFLMSKRSFFDRTFYPAEVFNDDVLKMEKYAQEE